MLDSTRRLAAHRLFGLRRCKECSAPEGLRIVRLKVRLILWSLDTDLHFEYPDAYREPAKVVITQDGRCAWCAHPFRGRDHVLHRKESHSAAD